MLCNKLWGERERVYEMNTDSEESDLEKVNGKR